jgi:hypothetical protein
MDGDRRVIKSVAELVNALDKEVSVESENGNRIKKNIIFLPHNKEIIDNGYLFYSEPVEVVELFYHGDLKEGVLILYNNYEKYDTHKQTQIIQNGLIIWTETEEIINK